MPCAFSICINFTKFLHYFNFDIFFILTIEILVLEHIKFEY